MDSTTLQPPKKVWKNLIKVDLRRFGRGRAQKRDDYPIRPPSPRSPQPRRIDPKFQGIVQSEDDDEAIQVFGQDQDMPLTRDVGSNQVKNSQMEVPIKESKDSREIFENLSSNISSSTNPKKIKKKSKNSSSNYPMEGFQSKNSYRLVKTKSGQMERSSGKVHPFMYKCPQVRNGVGRRQI